MTNPLVYSWIVIQILGLFILFAVGFLGFKVFQIFQLLSTIKMARTEFHKNLIELSAIYDQTYPKILKRKPSIQQEDYLDSTQTSSCDTALSQDSIDLPVEIPIFLSSCPPAAMVYASTHNVWLRYPISLEISVRKAMESNEPISSNLKVEETHQTHHNIPILQVLGNDGSSEKIVTTGEEEKEEISAADSDSKYSGSNYSGASKSGKRRKRKHRRRHSMYAF